MAVPFPPIASWVNGQIKVPLAPLATNALEKTYLTADMVVGTAMTVKSQKGFHVTTNEPLIIGEIGDEITELVETTTSSSPSTITLNSASIFAHKAGTPVYLIKFDQIEFSHSSTLTGSKSVLTANSGLYSIQPDKAEFILDETEFTTGFYFVRFKESVGSTFSDYSDGIEVGVWERNTVGFMITRALRNLGLELSENVTLNDCYEWLTKGMTATQGKLFRWPEHMSYNTIIGQAQRGTQVLAMPTDTYDTETNKSIIGVRIGDNTNLQYLDPVTFDNQMVDVRVTQVRSQASQNDSSLDVDNSYDFFDGSASAPSTASVYVANVKDTFTYTGVTRDDASGGSAAFTGIPTSGEDAIGQTTAVDVYVWQNEREGIPRWFTVRNGNLEWWPLVDGNEDNANIYMDYSKVATTINSDRDVIDYQRFDFLQSFLTWRMWCKGKNNGELDKRSAWYTDYKEELNDAIRTLPPNNLYKQGPKINRMRKHGPFRASLQNIPISDQ